MLSAAFMLSISNDYYFSYFSCGESEINNRGKKPKQTKTEKQHSEKFHLHFLEVYLYGHSPLPITLRPRTQSTSAQGR